MIINDPTFLALMATAILLMVLLVLVGKMYDCSNREIVLILMGGIVLFVISILEGLFII